jgi:sugar lactone lactonase YvrE
VVHDFGAGPGADGLCVDDRDRLIACSGDAADGDEAAIWLIGQDGKVLETQHPPGTRATNCSFGGADLTTLYVTTADGYVYRVANSGLRGRAIG